MVINVNPMVLFAAAMEIKDNVIPDAKIIGKDILVITGYLYVHKYILNFVLTE